MWKKRLVSMAMALVLAVNLLPTAAWAANSADSLSDLEMYLRWSGTQTIEVTGTIEVTDCLLYTSPSPRDVEESRMPSSA